MKDYSGYTIVTPSSILPVSLEELKLAMSITSDAKDNDLKLCLEAAITLVEKTAWISLINRTMKVIFDQIFPDEILLPCPPVVSVQSVKYYDTEGVLTTLASTEYMVDTISAPGRIFPAFNKTFPSTANIQAAVQVEYTAGYGAAASLIPANIKRIIIAIASDMFEHIESQSEINLTENYTCRYNLDSISFRRPY